MDYIQGADRNQAIMFPEVIDDYIEENNPVKFIDVFVNSLDMVGLDFKYSQIKVTGRPPYNPADLLKLYIYGYLNRTRSSRSLEKESKRNVEVMWLVNKLSPDFKTIADFRRDNRKAIKKVCREFTLLCKQLELFGGELIAVDGSKFNAVNSKKRNFNKKKLKRSIREIENKIDRYFEELEENDREEADIKIPSAEDLEEKIKSLKERKTKFGGYLMELEKSEELQISLTDPDSRLMKNNGKIEVCYNVQTVVDEKNKLIVEHEVTNDGSDHNKLSSLAKQAKETMGVEELELVADKGYYDYEEIKECVDNEITPYIPEPAESIPKKAPRYPKKTFVYNKGKDCYLCPAGKELQYKYRGRHHDKNMRIYKSSECKVCDIRCECTRDKNGRKIHRWEHEEILEEMRERVGLNREKVKLRKCLVEHPFGTIKRAMNQGYLLMRGLEKVGAEISLSVLSYNIKRVINIMGVRKLVEALVQNIPPFWPTNQKRFTVLDTFCAGFHTV